MKTIKYYKTESGKVPFKIWLDKLKDKMRRARISIRLERVEEDNFGDNKPVPNAAGLRELRFHNDGTRIYYAQVGGIIVLIFCAGSKDMQSKDIGFAKTYFADFKKRGEQSYEQ
jgi:putative addiction module killer protein